MTWFRVGGAGIPATLKNAMNAVFNKKFGTSGQNYPPKQWPDDVNLLGPLPEATVSGNPAIITDGADQVPTKNVVVTLPASLTGYNSASVENSGKNFIDDKHFNSGLPATAIDSSIDSITASTRYCYWGFISPKKTIAIRCETNDTSLIAACLFYGYNNGKLTEYRNISAINSTRYYDTTSYDYIRIGFGATSGNAVPLDFTDYGFAQAEIGTTFTYYAPYIAPTSYSANLGRTIYGGTADLVTGEGMAKNSAPLTFDGSEDWRADTTRNGVYLLFSTMGTQNFGDGICNMFTTIKTGSGLNSLGICFGVNNYAIYIPHLFDGSIPEVTDVATWETYLSTHDCTISYPLATPTDFSFSGQEIDTRLGYNAFMSDQGDSEVTYRRDIDLALQAVSSSRGLMMASRPVTQLIGEESDPDQVNELVENDETEQEGEDNAR